jgi:hypothetical protein
MSLRYEAVKLGPNQDPGRVVNEYVQHRPDMQLVTAVPRGSSAVLVFGPLDQARSEEAFGEATADGSQLAFQLRIEWQHRYEAKVANARVADEARKQRAEARITAMSSTQREELRTRATGCLPPLGRDNEVLVRAKMRELVGADEQNSPPPRPPA